jgi:hypothetical protein
MPILRIEHPVADFDAWKRTFDSDPLGREQAGVRRYSRLATGRRSQLRAGRPRVRQLQRSESMRVALTEMWRRVEAEGLIGSQRAQIVETVETRDFHGDTG